MVFPTETEEDMDRLSEDDNDIEAARAEDDAVLVALTVPLGVGDRVANDTVVDLKGEAPFIVGDTASRDALMDTADEGEDDKLDDNDIEAAWAEGEGVAEADAVCPTESEDDMDRLSEDD